MYQLRNPRFMSSCEGFGTSTLESVDKEWDLTGGKVVLGLIIDMEHPSVVSVLIVPTCRSAKIKS